MGAFHLHAAKWEGPLHNPSTHDRHSAETDDRTAIMEQARTLAADGWAVWVYEHQHDQAPVRPGDPPKSAGKQWTVIAELNTRTKAR